MSRESHTPSPSAELLLETGILPPECSDALLSAYRTALEDESLTLTDALTIRDLLQLTRLDTPPDRALHALLIALCASRNQGSLCLHVDPEALGAAVERLTGQTLAPDEIRCLFAGLESGAYAGLVSDGDPGAPVVFDRGGPNLYFQRYFQHERRLQDALLARSSGGAVRSAFDPGAAREAAVAASRYARFTGESRGLNDEQLCGVYLALRSGFTIISGGPGTGKTTLVTSILRALVASGTPVERICLVAPTGRAGQRMGEAIRHSLALAGDAVDPDVRARLEDMAGSTIHRLLKFNPARNEYTYGPGNPLPADVVICDEVSMVDVVLMDRLLAALRDDARVVFLGDKDQLPSVEAGAVLGDLIPRNPVPLYSPAMKDELAELCAAGASLPTTDRITPLTDRIVLLTQSHRARGPVLETASRINSGSTAAVGEMRVESPRPVPFAGLASGGSPARRGVLGLEWRRFGDECVRLEPGPKPRGVLRQVLLSWTDALFQCTSDGVSLGDLLRRDLRDADLATAALAPEIRRHILTLFELMQQGQILTLLRRGGFGCEGINRFLAEFWRDRLDPRCPRASQIFSGAPIMVTRNDHRRNLFNGDTGIVLRASDSGRCHAVFRRGDAVSVFPVETLPDCELCFAMTVHKSQGSEYGSVLLVLPVNRNHPLLTREIVYTGITRTRDNAFVFASDAVLRRAVARRIERHSGIDLWRGAEPEG